jgi:transcriptional regulator with XRE-family HTH domain
MLNQDPLQVALARSRKRRGLPDPRTRQMIRVRAGLSQGELAAVIGVDRASISRWESGAREPADAHLASYLEALDRLMAEVVGSK